VEVVERITGNFDRQLKGVLSVVDQKTEVLSDELGQKLEIVRRELVTWLQAEEARTRHGRRNFENSQFLDVK
jgi:hypothetical protein